MEGLDKNLIRFESKPDLTACEVKTWSKTKEIFIKELKEPTKSQDVLIYRTIMIAKKQNVKIKKKKKQLEKKTFIIKIFLHPVNPQKQYLIQHYLLYLL